MRLGNSYFQAQFHRIKTRRGAKRAVGAIAASLLRTIYHMLKDGTLYQDLGGPVRQATRDRLNPPSGPAPARS
jgi:hypothetical protein